MGDTWATEILPEAERNLIGLPRRFDFLAESFKNDPFVHANLNVNRNLFIELLTRKLTGIFIYDLRVLLPSDNEASVEQAEPSSSPVTLSHGKKVSYGSMLVPVPILGSVFLFKSISKVTEHTWKIISDSLRNQLQFINAHLESPVHVRVMLTFKNEIKSNQKTFSKIETEVERVCFVDGLSFINLDFKFCIDKKPKVEDFDCEPRPSDGLEKLMKKVSDSDLLTQNYTLSPKMYKHFGGETFKFTELEEVIRMFHIYFPGFDVKLEMIPDCNRIKDNLLYSTNENAMFKGDESKYMGEVKWFLDKFIPMLEPITGVMIKNWDHHLFNNLLSSNAQFQQDFEFDYLLCSKKNLVVFEVAATKKSESPETTVMNKLDQSITKILPTLKILTATILEKVPDNWFTPPEDKRMKVQTFIRDNLKVIVYLPNATIHGFKTVIKNNNDIRQFLDRFKSPIEKTEALSQIYFVMHKQETSSEKLVAFKLKSNLDMEELGDPRLVLYTDSETSKNLMLYISALIAFSKLICENVIAQPETSPLDVDERYKKSGSNPNLLDIILSPQQESILNSENHKLWLRGEPGSGKTALLLAKAIQLAEKPEIIRVFYAISSKMNLLRSTIKKEIDKHQRKCTNKIRIVSFHDYDHLRRQVQEDLLRSESCQLPSRETKVKRKFKNFLPLGRSGNLKNQTQHPALTSALFIDEVYVNEETKEEINQFAQFEANIVWIAEVVRNHIQINLAETIKEIKVVNLTVLYRNSHHISQTASSLINSSGVTESTAVVHGCHTSSQKKIVVNFYSKKEQLAQVARYLLDSRFQDDRLFIYCTGFDGSKMCSAKRRKWLLDYTDNVYVLIGGETDKLPFAGCEKKSVVLVIDEHWDGISSEIIVLSITRAQYEVTVLINEKYPQIDSLLSYLRLAMPPHLHIYSKLKSGAHFTLPEPLATGEVEEVVKKLLDRLTKDEWLKFIGSMPAERREYGGFTLVDKEDIIVEIVKEPNSTWELLESILQQETLDQEALYYISEIRRLCKLPAKLNLGANDSKPNRLRGEILQKVIQAIWRRHEVEIMQSLNFKERNEVMTALKIMKRYDLLQEHLERPENLILLLSRVGEEKTIKQVLAALAENSLLQYYIKSEGRLFPDLMRSGQAKNVKAALEFLAERNHLQFYLTKEGGFFPEFIWYGEVGNVKAALEILAKNNLFHCYFENEEGILSEFFRFGKESNVKAALEVLAETSLLRNYLEHEGGIFYEFFRYGKTSNVKAAVEVLVENNLLHYCLENKGGLFSEFILRGEESIVKAALKFLAEKNLLQLYLKKEGGLFSEFMQCREASIVKAALDVLAENDLILSIIENKGKYFAEFLRQGEASNVKAALEVLVEQNLLHYCLENKEGIFSEFLRQGEASNVKAALEVLVEHNLLHYCLENKGSLFSEFVRHGEASNVKAALEVLAENDLIHCYIENNGKYFSEFMRHGEASNVMAALEVLAENNLLQYCLENKGRLFFEFILRGEESIVKAALKLLADKNLLQLYLKNEGGLFFEFMRWREASIVKAVLDILAEDDLIQSFIIENKGEFFSQFMLYGKTSNVKAAFEFLAEKNLLQFSLEFEGGFVYEVMRYGEASNVKAALEVLAANNLLQYCLENKRGQFFEIICIREESIVKTLLELLREKNLDQFFPRT